MGHVRCVILETKKAVFWDTVCKFCCWCYWSSRRESRRRWEILLYRLLKKRYNNNDARANDNNYCHYRHCFCFVFWPLLALIICRGINLLKPIMSDGSTCNQCIIIYSKWSLSGPLESAYALTVTINSHRPPTPIPTTTSV